MTVEYDLGGPEERRLLPADDDGSSPERFRRRRVWGICALVLGVAALLVCVALPAVAASVVRAPTDARQGLPDHWFAAPAKAPTVVDWPMRSAGVLLEDGDGRWSLVSSDGRRYARLPLGVDDSAPALSDDGRLVAWMHRGTDLAGSLHVLRLEDGRETVARIPVVNFVPIALRWSAGAFEASGWSLAPGAREAHLDEDSTPSCFLVPMLSTPDRFAAVDVQPARACSQAAIQTATLADASGDYQQYVTVRAPGTDDARTAYLAPGDDGVYRLEVTPENPARAAGGLELALTGGGGGYLVNSAHLLAWPQAGFVVQVQVQTEDDSLLGTRPRRELRVIDPDDGASRSVATSGAGALDVTPMAVAPGVVGFGRTVAGHPPSYPSWPAVAVAAQARHVRADLPWLATLAVLLPVALVLGGVTSVVLSSRNSTREAGPARP